MKFSYSQHVLDELRRRAIPERLLDTVPQQPEEILPVRAGRHVYQSRLEFGSGKLYLARAIVDDTVDPATVVAVYRTSKIGMCRRQS